LESFAWASALAAADFEAALVRPSRRTDEAAEAASGEVCFFGELVCDNALAAAAFDFALVLGLLSTLEALEAALEPVVLLAITTSLPTECTAYDNNTHLRGGGRPPQETPMEYLTLVLTFSLLGCATTPPLRLASG
jgi:hypothetical protein